MVEQEALVLLELMEGLVQLDQLVLQDQGEILAVLMNALSIMETATNCV